MAVTTTCHVQSFTYITMTTSTTTTRILTTTISSYILFCLSSEDDCSMKLYWSILI